MQTILEGHNASAEILCASVQLVNSLLSYKSTIADIFEKLKNSKCKGIVSQEVVVGFMVKL